MKNRTKRILTLVFAIVMLCASANMLLLYAWENSGTFRLLEFPEIRRGSYKAELTDSYLSDGSHLEADASLTISNFTVLNSNDRAIIDGGIYEISNTEEKDKMIGQLYKISYLFYEGEKPLYASAQATGTYTNISKYYTECAYKVNTTTIDSAKISF